MFCFLSFPLEKIEKKVRINMSVFRKVVQIAKNYKLSRV